MKNGSYLAPSEAALMERIPNHPNVIRLYDYGECRGFLVLVMERSESIEKLRDYLDERKWPVDDPFLSLDMVKTLFRQILTGLMHCRASGVEHRNFNLDSILLEVKTFRPKIIDFSDSREIKSDRNSVPNKSKSDVINYLVNLPSPILDFPSVFVLTPFFCVPGHSYLLE